MTPNVSTTAETIACAQNGAPRNATAAPTMAAMPRKSR